MVVATPLVLASSSHSTVAHLDPVPLALFGPGCVYRGEAEQALTAANRKYRHAYNSASRDGLDAAVNAGLAVTMIPRSVMPDSWVELRPDARFPELPEIELLLFVSTSGRSPAVDAMEATIRDELNSSGTLGS